MKNNLLSKLLDKFTKNASSKNKDYQDGYVKGFEDAVDAAKELAAEQYKPDPKDIQ